jgi:SAM-dependent methyltransferase
MITDLRNKMLTEFDCGTHTTVCDGPVLGGCGKGEVGDPNTWLPEVWKDVIDKYGVKSVLDVGCGYGYSTAWFEQQGLKAFGIEGSDGIVFNAVTDAVHCFDFRNGKPNNLEWPESDLAWCSEFLEHVRAEYEPCYMAALVRCRFLLISAALPGFRGHHHVNEQPTEYWIERFHRHGFEVDAEETDRLRKLAHDVNPSCYFQANGLFFRRVKEVRVRTHWTDLEGPLKPDDAETLQRLARGRKVLLIGGNPQHALALAETAKQVTVINVEPDELGGLLAAVKTAGFDGRVEVTIDETIESEEIAARRFEMASIPNEVPLEEATRLAADVLLPGGHIIWSDWEQQAVRREVESAGIKLHAVVNHGHLGVLETAKWRAMVVMPHSRGVELQSYKSLRMASIGRFVDSVAEMDMECGCLPHSFNCLLCQCLDWMDQGRCTHLAMIHSDVTAERGWLDLLAEEMHIHGFAAISSVVAIKDPDQDRTSTAIGSKSDPWHAKRYIHRRQYGGMPTTFTGKDVCEGDDEVLLINTGLMLLDLRHPFWDTFCFQVPTAIFKVDGKRCPIFRPEDWEMSRELDKAGVPYGATWRPFVEHLGGKAWDNRPMTVQVVENA